MCVCVCVCVCIYTMYSYIVERLICIHSEIVGTWSTVMDSFGFVLASSDYGWGKSPGNDCVCMCVCLYVCVMI